MESIEEKILSQNNKISELLPVKIRCPVCKSEKKLKFPKMIINQAKQLTTISIPKGLVCEHHFQTFVDKNFMVRGYQKVDFEYAYDIMKSRKSIQKEGNNKNKEFTEYVIIEENYLAYKPEKNKIIIEKKSSSKDFREKFEKNNNSIEFKNKLINTKPKNSKIEGSVMNLEDIYNEFWDFIDRNNKKFQEFIKKDTKRVNLTESF